MISMALRNSFRITWKIGKELNPEDFNLSKILIFFVGFQMLWLQIKFSCV